MIDHLKYKTSEADFQINVQSSLSDWRSILTLEHQFETPSEWLTVAYRYDFIETILSATVRNSLFHYQHKISLIV